MTIEILLIECSFAIPVALPDTYNTNLHLRVHNNYCHYNIIVGTLYYIITLSLSFDDFSVWYVDGVA